MKSERRAASRWAGWAVAGATAVVLLASGSVWAVADTSEPIDSAPAETTLTEPAAPEPAEAPVIEPLDTTADATDAVETVPASEPVDTEPALDTAPVDSPPPVETEVPAISEAPASSVQSDCTATVEGDGPVELPAGCSSPTLPRVGTNPALAPTCGLSVTIVVDRSASIDAGAARSTVAAIVDGLVDTGSTVALVDFADDAAVRIGAAELTSDSRGSFDSYSPGTGGRSNLAAGIAAAPASELTIVVTDGVANAGGGAPDQALAAAVVEANRLKAAGTHVFAAGIGAADSNGLAAISGGGAGSDVANAGYSVGDAAALTASLAAMATDGCPMLAAADDGMMFAPMALVDEGNTGAISVPAAGSPNQIGPASPYPSTITISGETGLVTDVDVHLLGLSHGVAQDIDMLLVGPSGQNLVVMSDVGGAATLTYFTDANVTIDDGGSDPPSSGQVTGSVTWLPTNNAFGSADAFPAPAPTPSGNTTLAGSFAGTNPNGVWSLYAVDDATGDTGSISGGWSLTINTEEAAVATTTTVTSSANPTLVAGDVTFTATVLAGATPVTTGTVTFTDGATTLGTPVNLNGSGQATLTTDTLAEGTHTIRATFNGAPGFLTSNGTVSQIVDTPTSTPATGQYCNTGAITGPGSATASNGPTSPYPSRITVSGISGPITLVTAQLAGVAHTAPIDFDVMLVSPTGQNLVLMSDVGGTAPVSGVTLTFADSAGGTIPAAGPLVGGTYRPTDSDADSADGLFPAPAPAASAATTLAAFNGFEAAGVWQLFVYDDATGDTGQIGGGWCLNIEAAAPTTTTLTSSVNPSVFGDAVTFTATVTSGAGSVTGGTVTFRDGATELGTVALSGGEATLSTSALTVGTHPITATYSGASAFQTSTSSGVSQVVNRQPSVTTMQASVNPSTFGQSVTFTATVTSESDPVTTGTVTFTDGATTLGPAVPLDASGLATFTTSTLAVGIHSITAVYSGTATVASSDDALDQVVDGVADAGGPYSILEGESLLLDGRGSLVGPGASYSWDIDGDGVFGDRTVAAPTLTWDDLEGFGFDGDGTPRQVELRVTDGVEFYAVAPLTIANVAPTARDAINDGPVPEGSRARVTVVDATDPSSTDAANLTYLFDYGDDGSVDATSSDPWVDVPAAELGDGPGTLVVSAVVADPDGGESAPLTTTITITNAAATATIDGPSTAVVGEPVTIKVGAVDPSSVDMAGTFLFTVDWGDGTPPVTLPGPADPPVTHTYTTAGTFTVVATVVDPDGAVSDPLEFLMTVIEQVPTTTTSPPSTTTPARTTAPPTTAVAPALPATGGSPSQLVLFAVALLGAGGVVFAASRKVRSATAGERDNFSGP